MLRTVPIMLVALLTQSLLAQDTTTAQKPCTMPESSQFDFWVGEWDLNWADSGRGQNIITKEFNGCVIRENFTTLDSVPFRGMSVSVFNPNTSKWHQTWVDNNGSYLDFVGEWHGDRMILSREAKPKDKPAFLQRMVWYDIAADSLKWNWERSDDGGKTWKVAWGISYVRRK